jgi:glycosyltransferase involved in cell wall biosynthesis
LAFTNYRILSQRRMHFTDVRWVGARFPQLNMGLGALRSVFERAAEIGRHVGAFKPSVLVACTASPFDLPACTLVALRRRLPLVTYLFDDPIYQWVPGPLRDFARLWEPLWSRVAAAVVVPNEAMQQELCARRRKQAVLVRNPVPREAFARASSAWPARPGQYRIVYTGSVYHAQADAFLNLLHALRLLDSWSLHIYTSQSEAELQAYGIEGPQVVRHEHVTQRDAYEMQQAADVLFLPLAFSSAIPEVLRTSAPMKMGEYLASGRPILVNAPPETFTARHVGGHDAGYVVDAPEPALLANALRSIASEPDRRRAICENALHLAETYTVDRAREDFWNLLRSVAR